MKDHETSWLRRIRNVLCVIYLILFVLFETYSASATALDHSNRFPAWEAKVGWGLFVLPCLLLTGLVFLLLSERRTIGFTLAGLSTSLYLAFMFLEDALSREPWDRRAWLFDGIWITLCAFATAAAWLLKRPLRSELPE